MNVHFAEVINRVINNRFFVFFLRYGEKRVYNWMLTEVIRPAEEGANLGAGSAEHGTIDIVKSMGYLVLPLYTSETCRLWMCYEGTKAVLMLVFIPMFFSIFIVHNKFSFCHRVNDIMLIW